MINVSQRLQFRTYETLLGDLSDLRAAGMSVRNIWQNWDRVPFTGSENEALMIVEATAAEGLQG